MKLSNLPANIVLSRRNGEGLRPWREWLRTLWRVMLPVADHAEPAKAKNPATTATVQGTRECSAFSKLSPSFYYVSKKSTSLAQLRYLVTRSLPVVKAAAVDLLPSAS